MSLLSSSRKKENRGKIFYLTDMVRTLQMFFFFFLLMLYNEVNCIFWRVVLGDNSMTWLAICYNVVTIYIYIYIYIPTSSSSSSSSSSWSSSGMLADRAYFLIIYCHPSLLVIIRGNALPISQCPHRTDKCNFLCYFANSIVSICMRS